MRRRTVRLAVMACALAVVMVSAAAAGETRWVDVRVERTSGGPPIALHLPAAFAGAALEALEVGRWHGGVVPLGAPPKGLPGWEGLLAMLNAMRPGDSLEIAAGGTVVRARRTDSTLHLHAVREGERAGELRAAIPAEALRSVSVTPEGELDLRPLLETLATFPPGELARGHDATARFRVLVE